MDTLRRWLHAVRGPLDWLVYHTILYPTYLLKLREIDERIENILACPDYELIQPVPDAGKVIGRTQVMHNGVLVLKDCYYRWKGTRMFKATRGIHEPQEERVFAAVLPYIKPGGLMLELGAYWGFYSLWFAKEVPDARCVLIEPRAHNLFLGRENFRLNGRTAEFIQASVGKSTGRHGGSMGDMISVDSWVEKNRVKHIDILHSDIQGYETEMLLGAAHTLREGMVDFAFISTHGREIHERCRDQLLAFGFTIIADADMQGTYSFDGILVGQHKNAQGPGPIPISQRPEV